MSAVTEIPLAYIVDHPDQPRYGEGDVDALAASILEVGQLEPVIVLDSNTTGGPRTFTVLAGHRRTAALRKLGRQTVRAIVLEAVDREDAVKAIMASNTAREALTPLEEARGYQTMLDLGITPKTVAKITGRKKAHVEQLAGAAEKLGAEKVAELTEVQLTVDEMEALARHADSKSTYKKLLKEVGNRQAFEWAARQADQAKEKAEVKAGAKAIIAAAGVADIIKESDFYGQTNARLAELVDADGNDLDPAAHASCPGACAAITGWATTAQAAVQWGCRDWESHGHKRRHSLKPRELTPEEIAEREERERIREAWDLAGELRREFLAGLAANGSKRGDLLADFAPLAWGSSYHRWRNAAVLLGWGETDDWKLTPGQKPAQAFIALGLAAGESSVKQYIHNVPYYAEERAAAIDYLRILEAHGYELHDPELDFIARCEAVGKEEAGEACECRVCGCTDAEACDDDGQPCHWVEDDLCSACVDAEAGEGEAE